MNLQEGYLEEDLFPKLFTNYEERSYGILFFNEINLSSRKFFSLQFMPDAV